MYPDTTDLIPIATVDMNWRSRILLQIRPPGDYRGGVYITLELRTSEEEPWVHRFSTQIRFERLSELLDGLVAVETYCEEQGYVVVPPDADQDGEAAAGW